MTCYSEVAYGQNMHPQEDPTDIGEFPAVLIQEDFELFSERLDDEEKQGALLDEILWSYSSSKGDWPRFDSRSLYTRRETLFDVSLSSEWKSFCRQVKTDPNADWEFDNIDRWIKRTAVTLPTGHLLFRARPGFDSTGTEPKAYAGADIGAPTACKAGRANDMSQRVLYCADQASTAVSEVRPYTGEILSVCHIEVGTDTPIADLENGLVPPNPFTTRGLRHELEIFRLLRRFSQQLSKPLDQRDDEADYAPCRYLASVLSRKFIHKDAALCQG
jgi:hypothetical protein